MNITLNQIFSLIGRLDDTPGDDVPRERFRTFLKENVTEIGKVRDYIPVVIDSGLRSKLDAFSDKSPDTPWAWFVQSTHKLNKRDFSLLTLTQ